MSELTRPITVDELTRGIANARARRGWTTAKPVVAEIDLDDDDSIENETQPALKRALIAAAQRKASN